MLQSILEPMTSMDTLSLSLMYQLQCNIISYLYLVSRNVKIYISNYYFTKYKSHYQILPFNLIQDMAKPWYSEYWSYLHAGNPTKTTT